MVNFDELLTLDGVAAAGEFASDGKIIEYKSNIDIAKEIAEVSAQFCATVSMLFNTLAVSEPAAPHPGQRAAAGGGGPVVQRPGRGCVGARRGRRVPAVGRAPALATGVRTRESAKAAGREVYLARPGAAGGGDHRAVSRREGAADFVRACIG